MKIGHIGRFIEKSKFCIFWKKGLFLKRKLGLEESEMVWWGNIHKLKVPPRHSLQTHKSHFSISALSNFGLFSLKDFRRGVTKSLMGNRPKLLSADIEKWYLWVCRECRGGTFNLWMLPHQTISDSSRADFHFKNRLFFQNMANFDFSIIRPIWPILMKKC